MNRYDKSRTGTRRSAIPSSGARGASSSHAEEPWGLTVNRIIHCNTIRPRAIDIASHLIPKASSCGGSSRLGRVMKASRSDVPRAINTKKGWMNMKKVSGILFALVLALSFSACTTPNESTIATPTESSTALPTESQSEPIVTTAAEDVYADLSHLPESKRRLFQTMGYAPSSLHTAFSGDIFLSTAHRGVVSVYTGDLFGNDKKNETIVVSLLDDGGMDRIQANYNYFGDEGLTTEVLLSTTLDYTYHPGHQDPPTLFIYRYGGKTYFCCQYTGGNEYGGGSFAHYGLVYTEILPSGKKAVPISLEYGHHAGQHWYAAVYEGDAVLSSSEDVYSDDGSYEKEVSFDAIDKRLKQIGLFSESAVGGYFEDRPNDNIVHLKEINEKTPGVTMLVSGSISFPEDSSYSDGTWTVEYIDHLKYD